MIISSHRVSWRTNKDSDSSAKSIYRHLSLFSAKNGKNMIIRQIKKNQYLSLLIAHKDGTYLSNKKSLSNRFGLGKKAAQHLSFKSSTDLMAGANFTAQCFTRTA